MPPGHRTRLAALAALSILAAALTGCGTTRVVGRRTSVGVAVSEYAIRPQSISAHPGLLTFIVHNYGVRTHNLVVTLNGTTIGSTPALAPGGRSRLTVAVVSGGRYTIASTVRGDQSLGAYGSLSVGP